MTAPFVVDTSGIAPIPPVSCDDWLRVLTRKMDLRRLGVLMTRSYVDGNAPLPEMSRTTKQSWMHFQRRARTNWGELIIDSVTDRVKPTGLTINGSNSSAKAKQAQAIWRDNRMSGVFKEFLRYGLIFGQSYLTIWSGQDTPGPMLGMNGTAYGTKTVITADSPETMIVITDPLQHWKPKVAMKVWRDQEMARDYAIVWTPTEWKQYVRPTYTRIELKVIPSKWLVNLAEGAWAPDRNLDGSEKGGASQIGPQPIPVVVYQNPGGHGDYETHIDLINRVNAGILERLVISAMLSFRQRALVGKQLPSVDENGNRINWEEVFEPAPGALWNLPEGLDIWESQPTDLSGILAASKEDIRQLSAVTKTPLPMLMPDNANTSAEGAKATEVGYLFRCMDRLDEAKFAIESAMDLAFKVDGGVLEEGEYCEVPFNDPQLITLTEKYQAALAAHNAGESWKSIERNILHYSPDQIAQDDIDRAQEALLAQTMPPLPTSVNERLTGQAPGAAPAETTNGSPVTNGAPKGQQPQPKPPLGIPPAKKVAVTQGGTQPGGRVR